MELRRELIARDPDRSNHRLGRQRAAFEPVDANDRARPCHLLQLLLKNSGIVRQRFDLVARQRRAERGTVAIRCRLLLVLLDGDLRLDALDGQHGHLAVLAGTNAHIVQHARLESREFRFDRVAPRRERGNDRHTHVGRLHRRERRRLRRLVCARDGHRRTDDDRIGLIDDGDAKRTARGLLEEKRQRDGEGHFGASNFFGSIFTLMLTRSNVVSSMVSPATARRMRNGHLVPLTSR